MKDCSRGNIKYTLFIADGFSYIFDNTFNRSNVVFSLMVLNTTFLDNINQIHPKVGILIEVLWMTSSMYNKR